MRGAAAILVLACAALVGCDEDSDKKPLVVTITSPTTEPDYDTNIPTVVLEGSARHGEKVTRVTWENAATLGTGTATGTHAWGADVPLAVGDNAITVTGHDSADDDGYDSIDVNYQPGFHLDPQVMAYEAVVGGPDPASRIATMTFNGAAAVSWVAAGDAPWLGVSPASGMMLATDTVSLDISVGIGGLTAGTYTGTVIVADTTVTFVPRTVRVALVVSP
jgi:hypothetical protein